MSRAVNHVRGRADLGPALVTLVSFLLWLGLGARRLPAQPCDSAVYTLPTVSARYSHAMAYDSARDRAVLFGGTDTHNYFDNTYEWIPGAGGPADGSWVTVATSGPAGRESHAMAYDAARHVVVLFGGLRPAEVLGDTWTWNGSTWTQMNVPGPLARHSHTMVYDSVRQRVVLFGGIDLVGNVRGDTWEWNGSAWSQVSNVGPAPRYAHAAAFDSVRQRTVLYGGAVNDTYSAETWEWNGSTWTRTGITGAPAGRTSHTLDFDVVRGKVVLFAGYSNAEPPAFRNDVWEYNGDAWSQRTASGAPTARGGQASLYDPVRQRLVVMGGTPNALYHWGDTQFLPSGSSSWLRASASPPTWDSPIAYDTERHTAVMYAGAVPAPPAAGTYERESQPQNGAAPYWVLRATTGPSPRNSHSLGYDPIRHRTVLFGGYDPAANISLGETWEWDGQTWSLRANTGPSPRSNAKMVFDPVLGKMLLFGATQANDDTWTWDGSTWVQLLVNPPTVPFFGGPSLTYDTVRGRAVLWYSGHTGQQAQPAQLWEWNSAAMMWSQRLFTSGPLAGTLAFDSDLGVTVLRSEESVWTWNGSLWREIPLAPEIVPRAAGPITFVYESGAHQFLIRTGYTGDSWNLDILASSPSIVEQPRDLVVLSGDPGVFTVVAQGDLLEYQWRFRDSPLSDDSRRSGVHTPTLTINPVGPSDFGSYDCVITSPCASIATCPSRWRWFSPQHARRTSTPTALSTPRTTSTS